ncbi:AI-2E family transporter [Dorea sp.]
MKKEENTYYKETPKFGRNGPSKLKLQFKRGMTYFLVIVACILVYFAMLRIEAISNTFSKILDILKPVLYGCLIAYFLNPIVRKVDQYLVPALEKNMKNKEKAKNLSRSIGVAAAVVIMIAVVTALINMMIPELINSIRNLIFTLPSQINQLVKQVNNIKLDDSTMTSMLKNAMNEASTSLQNWIRTDLLNKVNELMTHLTVGLYTLVMEMFHAVVGVIVSVYILFGKEKFISQSKKAAYAIFPAERANLFIHIAVKTNEIFGGFIIGKIIDSIIIGILCFVGTSILNMPYAMLVSVIVGVTNVIPFFGPYIGAIPSAILIALTNPMKGIYFLIFILLLQQFDGNILGPKILGNSTGLSAFWVIVSILLGGGLFGIVGMLFGVPTFAVIYYVIKLLLDNKLEKKELPTVSGCYNEESYVDNEGVYHSGK